MGILVKVFFIKEKKILVYTFFYTEVNIVPGFRRHRALPRVLFTWSPCHWCQTRRRRRTMRRSLSWSCWRWDVTPWHEAPHHWASPLEDKQKRFSLVKETGFAGVTQQGLTTVSFAVGLVGSVVQIIDNNEKYFLNTGSRFCIFKIDKTND